MHNSIVIVYYSASRVSIYKFILKYTCTDMRIKFFSVLLKLISEHIQDFKQIPHIISDKKFELYSEISDQRLSIHLQSYNLEMKITAFL